jgi:hypothetical protein
MSSTDPFTYFLCGTGIIAVATLVLISLPPKSIPTRLQNITKNYIAVAGLIAVLILCIPMIAGIILVVEAPISAIIAATKGNIIPLIIVMAGIFMSYWLLD